MIVDILKNVSIDWSHVLSHVWACGAFRIGFDHDCHYIDGLNITWRLQPQYPNCQYLNISEYVDSDFTPMFLEFHIGINSSVEVLLYIEDKRKVVDRTLESNMLAYVGPSLKIGNSDNSQEVRAIISLSQKINIKEDKNAKCTNYPNELYQNYKDCDQQFVSAFMEKLNITPFWATADLHAVTNKR